jgi:hypothetical protein
LDAESERPAFAVSAGLEDARFDDRFGGSERATLQRYMGA